MKIKVRKREKEVSNNSFLTYGFILVSLYSEDLLVINPYHAFVKPTNSVTRSTKSLIKRPSRNVKKYVQETKFDQHRLPTTEQEQFLLSKSQLVFHENG